jgi:AAA ATPase-like protein
MGAVRIVGREPEVSVLRAVVQTGLVTGSTLLVMGEPGIGKSALLAAARIAAHEAGYTVLRAAGAESEMHLPFGGIQQAVAPLTGHLPVLPDAQRDALATALGLGDGATPDLFLIAEAVFTLLLIERRDRPVIIVVDDVQWLDPQSHQILAFVAHRGAGNGVSVVGAIRPGHPGPFAQAEFPRLPLGGLDDDAADQILSMRTGAISPANRKRIREVSQGNPLALWELPRSWGEGAPTDDRPLAVSARLERAFAGRISELARETRDVLLIAAVGSSSDKAEILTAWSAFGTAGSSSDVLGPAVVAGLLTDAGAAIGFRHPLVRSAVLQLETMARRHSAHAAWADVLITDAYRRTWHRGWSIVGPDDDVAEALAATVPDSLRRGAVMSAVSSLERSAQLTGSPTRRGRRLMWAGDLAFGAGRADVVARLIREASKVDLTDLDHTRLTWLTEVLNDDIQANSALVRRLCASARRADALGDVGLALNLLLCAAVRCWWADSGADDRAEVVQVLDRLTETPVDPRHIDAVAVAEPVLRGSEVMRFLGSIALDDETEGDRLRVYGQAAYCVGDFVLATDLLDRAEESFRAEGRLGMLPLVLALQLHIRLDLGDWVGAELASKEVATISRETGQPLFAENNVLVEARRMGLRGQWRSALEIMAGAESEATRLRINDRICLAYQARGVALMSAERPAQAFTCLKRQFDPSDPGYHLRESFAGVALMAEAAVDCGRANEARGIVQSLETVAMVTPSPLLEVNLLYARAVLAAADARDCRYQDALAHDLTRWPWLRARIQLAYGRWLAQSGRCGQAGAQLKAASAVFEHIGATRWYRCTVSELRGLNGSAPGAPGSPPGRRS